MAFSILDPSVVLCRRLVDLLLCLEMLKACSFKLFVFSRPIPTPHKCSLLFSFPLFPTGCNLLAQPVPMSPPDDAFSLPPCHIASSPGLTQTLPGSCCLPRYETPILLPFSSFYPPCSVIVCRRRTHTTDRHNFGISFAIFWSIYSSSELPQVWSMAFKVPHPKQSSLPNIAVEVPYCSAGEADPQIFQES